MGENTHWGVIRPRSDSPRNMSNCCVCKIAGLIQASEIICIPDVSTNGVSTLHAFIIHLGHDVGICLSTDTSSYLLFRHRKMSAYMYSTIRHIVVWYQPIRHRKMSEIWRKLLHRPKPMCVVWRILMCAIYQLLSAVQLWSQRLPFSILHGWKTM